MHAVPLVETTRGYPDTGFVTENVHMGSVAVVDAAGKLLWFAGNPVTMAFTRSALKPFQALPFVLADGPARFGLSKAELALMCASHSGEEKHLQAVQSILLKTGSHSSELECGCHARVAGSNVQRARPVWAARRHAATATRTLPTAFAEECTRRHSRRYPRRVHTAAGSLILRHQCNVITARPTPRRC